MTSGKIKILTRTAILLAIAVVFQMAGRYMGPQNNFIVGPVVNAVLIIATAATGLWGGAAISVLAPLISAVTNKAPIAPFVLAFTPFIAVGNFILVLAFHLLGKKNKVAALLTGAALKFAFLFASVTVFIRYIGPIIKLPSKTGVVLAGLFSWPQFVTAVIGGILALIVLKALRNNL